MSHQEIDRGQILQGRPRGILGPIPFERRQHGNHPQGGNQWEVNGNHEVGQEAREEHGNRYQRGHQTGYHYNDQGGHGGRDVGINSIETTLPTFKEECNPDAYLECESQCDRFFNINELTEVKSSCYAIAQFEGNVVTWWEYMTRSLSCSRRSSSTMAPVEKVDEI
ncbi:hypothetical protein R3W88_004374 [Solanum pinnatisectum]|uniref:Uncharacterized protein n=1 Tax=Solanum pinnatisectum TaxID=50273 RepID=A0AAV9K949_9SOLN|nr:hypothetical protein R3W88_004374 [Solanum pinnatisectum]